MAEGRTKRSVGIWIGGAVGVVALLLVIAAFFIDEPVRRYIEDQVNAKATDYTLSIGALDLHPLGLSVDIKDMTVVQNEHPDPPMLKIPAWHASLQWSRLLKGQVVSDHEMKSPVIHVTRLQTKKEMREDQEEKAQAWQDAVQTMYPAEINKLKIEDGDVTYFDRQDAKPLHVSDLQVDVGDISNRSTEAEYPSSVRIDMRVFDQGRLSIDGRINPLARPYLALSADVRLEQIPIEDLVSLTGRYNLQLKGGMLNADGRVEFSPRKQEVRLGSLLLERVKADYVYRQVQQDQAKRTVVKEKRKQLSKNPEVVVTVDHGKILDSEMGFVNKSTQPEYRVFIKDLNAEVDRFSNHLRTLDGGDTAVKITGKFMGTGRTVVGGTFRPEKLDPDFDLAVKIVKTQLTSFNDILRAYGNFDVSKGTFSFFSELSIKNGEVQGYVKPMFKDVEVYDPKQDSDKAFTRKIYEAVVSGVVDMLKNAKVNQVAAESDVSGPVPDPSADTWQIVVTLIQNAFFEAILPGLEREQRKA